MLAILYEEVWAKPVVDVAVQYGVSDVAIHKICKSLNVPVPPRGYWAKLKAKKDSAACSKWGHGDNWDKNL